jgi:hypothetical protein
MGNENITAGLVFAGVSLLLYGIGYYIKKSKNIYIINFVSKKKDYHIDSMLEYFTAAFKNMALVTLIFSVVFYIKSNSEQTITAFSLIYCVLLIYYSIKITLKIKTLEKK